MAISEAETYVVMVLMDRDVSYLDGVPSGTPDALVGCTHPGSIIVLPVLDNAEQSAKRRQPISDDTVSNLYRREKRV